MKGVRPHGLMAAMEFVYTKPVETSLPGAAMPPCDDGDEASCRVVFIDGVPHVRIGEGCEVWRYHAQEASSPAGIVLDSRSSTLTFNGRIVVLTRTEYRIVAALAASPNTCQYDELCTRVWGDDMARERSSSVRAHLHTIRTKLHAAQLPDQLIENVRGQGLRLAYWAR